jgi:hypothetical protein
MLDTIITFTSDVMDPIVCRMFYFISHPLLSIIIIIIIIIIITIIIITIIIIIIMIIIIIIHSFLYLIKIVRVKTTIHENFVMMTSNSFNSQCFGIDLVY